eukprot:Gregarina_sp_Poly_1__2684@NODE_1738_length_3431_cov_979_474732_g1138_i0_p2_GENE_NODE_1738_length_3431_cov_979_474732_g1138_i0NODE_1738_length_3431_cov_979_474732_g1138_i0_p2_ORF_typecomplete_len186_score36_31NUDIX/PF00293_28/1_4e12_NODE_1738_length_3431_cov_979_474732_g1138_i06881245
MPSSLPLPTESCAMPDNASPASPSVESLQSALEVSAGVILMRHRSCNEIGVHEALVICRTGDLELPKGHVEGEETLMETALRELVEETGVLNKILLGPKIGVAKYMVKSTRPPFAGQWIPKEVHYFSAFLPEGDELNLGTRETATKTLKWISQSEWEQAKFRSDDQRTFVGEALRDAGVLRRAAQ